MILLHDVPIDMVSDLDDDDQGQLNLKFKYRDF